MERVEEATIPKSKRTNLLEVRAKTPFILRWLAIVALAVTVVAIGVGFYRERNKKDFRMIPGLAELSKDVTAVVNGYERRETDGNVLKYYVKADKATTFSDNHQELENAYFEVYDEKGEKFDRLNANKAIYIPGENNKKTFTAYFFGNVDVETRDNLKVKSEQLIYERGNEIIRTEEPVEFSRENISGKSTGAIAKIKEKDLELLKDVEINSAGEIENSDVKLQSARMTAGHAKFNQNKGQIALDQNVFINVVPPPGGSGSLTQPTDIRSVNANAFFENNEINRIDLIDAVEIYSKPTDSNPKYLKAYSNTATANFEKELSRVEMNENVQIETTNNNPKPTHIRAQNAVYEKAADKFDLKNAVEIVTVEDDKPTVIHSGEAIYEQSNGKIFMTGGAEITQGNDYIKGDAMDAQLFPNKKLQTGFARGNAYLKQSAPDRVTEVSANELNAFFGDNQQIQKSNANGNASVTITPAQSQNYSKATVFAPQSLNLLFRAGANQGVLNEVQTDGRTAIVMNAVSGNPNSAFRKITADNVKTVLADNGTDLLRAEAVGNSEIYVEPVQGKPDNYKSTVTAARFDCDFYQGNNAKTCVANGKGKAVLVPMVAGQHRGTRTLTADKLVTNFSQTTQDVERFDAAGNAKFSELDRNGVADQISYTASDQVVRLRGGEPTIWDSQARAKAPEIDWNTGQQKSFLRGRVSTTYYSQKQTNGAAPFTKSNAPVFVTANEAQFDHQTQVGVYLGNARAWQDNNYVRADKLILQETARRMDGEGNVQSLLYNVNRKGGKESNQPAYAASERVSYTDPDKHLRYEGSVDIRQGTDRMTGGVADIFLDENNDAKQTILQNNVIITQPNRRVTGTWAQYTTADETIILRGNPATVADAESGTSQGAQMTISLRDNRVVNQGGEKPNSPGRTRSVYKVKP